jgi:predicted small secreted protein
MNGELITQHCTSSSGPTNLGSEWVSAELIAYGDSLIQHKIDGELVLEYSNPQLDDGTPVTGGYIAVQSESHPTEFRSIRVLNLEGCMDEAASNYKSYYVKSKPGDCIYGE